MFTLVIICVFREEPTQESLEPETIRPNNPPEQSFTAHLAELKAERDSEIALKRDNLQRRYIEEYSEEFDSRQSSQPSRPQLTSQDHAQPTSSHPSSKQNSTSGQSHTIVEAPSDYQKSSGGIHIEDRLDVESFGSRRLSSGDDSESDVNESELSALTEPKFKVGSTIFDQASSIISSTVQSGPVVSSSQPKEERKKTSSLLLEASRREEHRSLINQFGKTKPAAAESSSDDDYQQESMGSRSITGSAFYSGSEIQQRKVSSGLISASKGPSDSRASLSAASIPHSSTKPSGVTDSLTPSSGSTKLPLSGPNENERRRPPMGRGKSIHGTNRTTSGRGGRGGGTLGQTRPLTASTQAMRMHPVQPSSKITSTSRGKYIASVRSVTKPEDIPENEIIDKLASEKGTFRCPVKRLHIGDVTWEKGYYVDGYISEYVSGPGLYVFNILDLYNKREYRILRRCLDKFYKLEKNDSISKLIDVRVGQFVVAKLNGVYCRAKVIESTKFSPTIFFIDEGVILSKYTQERITFFQNSLRCVFPMVVVSIPHHEEFGPIGKTQPTL